jgi:hypothetical protein
LDYFAIAFSAITPVWNTGLQMQIVALGGEVDSRSEGMASKATTGHLVKFPLLFCLSYHFVLVTLSRRLMTTVSNLIQGD